MSYDFDQIRSEALAAFDAAQNPDAVEELRIKYLGSKGLMKQIMGAMKDVPKEEKRDYGQGANQLKQAIQAAFDAAKERNGGAKKGPALDITRPGTPPSYGHKHLVADAVREITTIFQRMGFMPVDGPEVEDEFHNFEALNIPEGHPSRDESDNFFLEYHEDDGTPKPVPYLLRSQTSTIQIRAIEKYGVPLRVVAPGRVYRPDSVDATHHYSFTQIEGLAIDKGLTFRDLKGALELFVREFFGSETRYRLRPHYFPFTEVSAEVDITCESFSNIKKDWLEILGCGMVDPRVLKAVDIDPEVYTGFAWGMGVERIVMLRHGISDIRYLLENDIRFNEQFG